MSCIIILKLIMCTKGDSLTNVLLLNMFVYLFINLRGYVFDLICV